MKINTKSIIAAALILLSFSAIAKPDVKGSKDHPLVSRFTGAYITDYKFTEFDEASLPNQPIRSKKNVKALKLEGKITRINYFIEGNKSKLEVERNYTQALKSRGFKILFTCTNEKECGGPHFKSFVENSKIVAPSSFKGSSSLPENDRAILAKLTRDAGDVYVFLYTSTPRTKKHRDTVKAYIQIVEIEPMETGQVTVFDADTLQKSLDSDGKIALYGVYFDTDKAEVKPESKPQVEQIAKMLNAKPSLKLYVIGHTDSQGELNYNLDLSQRRAQAIVQSLTTTYKIDKSRLIAKGFASLSPVASNSTDSGRALNRRVEIVVQ